MRDHDEAGRAPDHGAGGRPTNLDEEITSPVAREQSSWSVEQSYTPNVLGGPILIASHCIPPLVWAL